VITFSATSHRIGQEQESGISGISRYGLNRWRRQRILTTGELEVAALEVFRGGRSWVSVTSDGRLLENVRLWHDTAPFLTRLRREPGFPGAYWCCCWKGRCFDLELAHNRSEDIPHVEAVN